MGLHCLTRPNMIPNFKIEEYGKRDHAFLMVIVSAPSNEMQCKLCELNRKIKDGNFFLRCNFLSGFDCPPARFDDIRGEERKGWGKGLSYFRCPNNGIHRGGNRREFFWHDVQYLRLGLDSSFLNGLLRYKMSCL